ncbi:MAG: hypothetical protein V1755_05435 [Chloroflexota bacterium]
MIRNTMQRWEAEIAALRRFATWPGFYPVTILLIGLLTYLFAIPSLGYYWDDWEVVFLLNARDPQLLAEYFAFDRPFAWPYQVMYAIFGLNPVAWHTVTLLLRWGGILLLYFALVEVWPNKRSYLRWLGALLLVYPGFLQQSISGAYNRHFAAFFVFALSIFLMVLGTRRTRFAWALSLAAWLTALIHIFTIEYFVGLELIRPLLLWLLVARNSILTRVAAARRLFLLVLPYLLILTFYFWWRLVVFPSTVTRANYAGDFKLLEDFDVSLVSGLLAVLTRAALDLIYATLRVWVSVLGDPDAWTLQGKISWFAFGLGALLALAFAFFHDAGGDAEAQSLNPPPSMVLFGLWAFLVSALPIWLTSKQLSTQGRWDDRFALAPMLGAGILVICLIAAFIRARMQQVLLTILLALSITTQVLVVNRYRLDWAVQNSYYWQLSWRVPALMPGTAIISFEQPSASIPGYDASFAMNLLFNGKAQDGVVPYWFFTNDRFLNFELRPEKPITYKDRNLRFTGNTSKAIAVVHQGERRCLQVLDSTYADQPFYTQNQEQLAAVSNVARILRNPVATAPARDVFGAEPPRTWCYYFEKADLARQYGDWVAILRLEQEAKDRGFAAEFGPELMPFIEAHAQGGNWQKALELSQDAQSIISEMEPLLCSTWTRLSQLPMADAAAVRVARQTFECPSP